MKEFFVNYGMYILYGIVILLDLIILLFRKNKTILTDKGVISDLIKLVNDAENLFKDGQEKMNYVVNTYIESHPLLFAEMVQSCRSSKKAAQIIKDYVEYILTSPQKKESEVK